MTAGHIRQRGRSSWELKFDAGPRDPEAGKRRIQYATVRGTKRDAQIKLRELLGAVDKGEHVAPSKMTVGKHVAARIDQWQAAGDISARTAERYRELADRQIAPHLGAKPVQRLGTVEIESWHAALRSTLSARTIGHAHRLLSHALSDGLRHGLVVRNVARIEGAPKVDETEVQVVPKERIGELVDKLRGRAMYTRAIVALFSGLRRGELLALRRSNVDLEAKVIRVREALEETKAHGLQVKAPKTKAGRREVSLPEIVVDALRDHRRQQLELRMALGAGKLPDDALVFPAPLKGTYQSPRAFSKEWARLAKSIGFEGISFHALRHTHASQLIDAGIDIVMISRRLGHAKPDITLRIYAVREE
jgi:integrase